VDDHPIGVRFEAGLGQELGQNALDLVPMEARPDVGEVLSGDESVREIAVAVAHRGVPPAVGLEAGPGELRVVWRVVVRANPRHQVATRMPGQPR